MNKNSFHKTLAFVWLAVMLVHVPVMAAKRLPLSASEVEFSYAKTVSKAAPAVVTVYAKREVRRANVPKFLEKFFRNDPRFSRSQIARSLGSGVIVDENGFIVTNYHVIKNARELVVALNDRREFPAKLISSDERSDLAVLQIDPGGEKLPFLEFLDSDTIEVGDLVLAIGNPFGVGQTITSGIISAISRSQNGINDMGFFLQTDAATNQGNSGGALVTLDGKLAGINTAIFSKTGGFMGIGFSIPSNIVHLVARAAISGSSLQRPWLGADLQEVNAALARASDLEKPGGALIAQIFDKSPAQRAGLKAGDIILRLDKHEIQTVSGLRYHMALAVEKKNVRLAFSREGQWQEADLPIEIPPLEPPPDFTVLSGSHPLVNIRVGNLSPALAIDLRLNPTTRGVVVMEVAANSAAARLLRRGDIVLSVNGASMSSVDVLRNRLKKSRRPWRILLRRGRQTLTLNQK